jgi:para-aminobenzoate synthetase component 1
VLKLDTNQRLETPDGALAEPWDPDVDLESALVRLARRPHVLFLDSARRDARLGRYSFLAADPFDYYSSAADGGDGLAELARRVAPFRTSTIAGLPPFQGGAAGLLSYDLGRSLEKLPRPRWDEFQIPAIAMGLYDVVLAVDHVERGAWLISQGFPEVQPAARRRRAAERLAQFRAWLTESVDAAAAGAASDDERLPRDQLAPHVPVGGPAGLSSNFSAAQYLQAVRRAIEYIHAGDVFQVNIAQRLLAPAADDALSLYLRLRRRNAATFAGYVDLGGAQIVSASPERFVRVSDREAEARPIKGTRPRTAQPEADLFAGGEMLASEKDRAENVMIVDLLRNDLSRVCRADSVRVTQLCQVETYEYVQHLVSAVCGTLAAGRTPLDLVRAAFPGGSVTGAPKVRAMEIIAELEPTARGAYCGSLAYLGFDGALDASILIRTITASRGWWQAPVGGGIVAQSVPEREYEETWHKATGLLRAMH